MVLTSAGSGGFTGRLRDAVAEGGRGGGEPFFRRHFTATDIETRAALQALMLALDQAGVGDEDSSNAELILAEALNNVVEHAYADGAGPVELTVSLQRNGMACTISDRGRPMPSGVVPSPGLPVIDPPDDLPEGGFGWHIIRCLTSELAYQRDRDRNSLMMRLPWSDFD
mgnify:CR=1 FL=1